MRMPRRARLTVAVLSPFFVLAAPALAIADDGSGSDPGSSFQDTHTRVDRHGATSEQVRSCTDSDGNVYYQRTTRRANRHGVTTRRTHSGEETSACNDSTNYSRPDSHGNDDRSDRTQRHDGGDAPMQNDHSLISVSTGDISLFGDDAGLQ